MSTTKLFLALAAVGLTMTAATAQTGSDSCSTPDPLAGQGSFAFDNSTATTGLEGQLEPICYFPNTSAIDNDVWFSWTADATGIAQIGTCTSTIDSKIAAYPGGGCPTNGSAIACDDQGCGNQSLMAFSVTTGTTYLLQIGTWQASAGGTGNLDIVISAPAANDDCNSPTAIAGQGSFAFSQLGATTGVEGQGEPLCYAAGSSAMDFDVWFSWTADATGIAQVGTCTSVVDTVIAAYPGGGCPTSGTAIACNDQGCGNQSVMNFLVTAGTSYMLQVGVWPSATGGTGNLDILISQAPANDDCSAAAAIAGQGSFAFDNTFATTGVEGQTEPLCYFPSTSAIDNDIWFSWTADATGTAAIGTCTTGIDTKLAAYPGGGCPTNGSALACDDQGCGNQSLIVFPVTNNTTYMLQVGTWQATPGGAGNLDISILPPLLADDCATPTSISGQGTFFYDTTIATTGIEGQNETLCYAFGSSAVDKDIWYAWTSNATGPATVSTCNSTLDTKIAAYPGGSCPTVGSSIACNDDTCSLQSEIIFPAVAGTTYMLQIGHFPGAAGGTGTFDILVQGPAEPGTPFCFCDGSNSPCGNPGVAGNGCANGGGPNGANLTGSGTAIVGNDSMVLSASGVPGNQPGLYFQGNNAVNSGAGLVFGDGLRCAGSGIIRLGVRIADGSGASDTSGLPFAISVKGGVSPGDLKHYQLWYRDPAASPCGALFNLTNGYSVQW